MPSPTTAGYSGKPLATKLGLRPGQRVAIHSAPPGFDRTLGPLPAGTVAVGPRARSVDLVLLFVRSFRSLEAGFGRLASRLAPRGMLWVAWPKKASGVVTDLSEDRVRGVGLAAGLVDVKVCAVDDVWSGLKFVRRKIADPTI